MGERKKAVPGNVAELTNYLQKLADNQKHLKRVKVNTSNARVEIDLSFAANVAGYADSYIPIKRASVNEAETLVDKLMSSIKSGAKPSDTEAQALFDLIDQAG